MSGVSGFLNKTKQTIARGKQLAMEKLEKTEKTTDAEFIDWQSRYEANYKQIEKINKDSEKVIELLKELSLVESEVTSGLLKFYDSGMPLYGTLTRSNETTKLIDAERIRFEEEMNKNSILPTSKYLGQYKEIKDRIPEHNTRRLDMDRYARDMKSHYSNNHSEKYRRAEIKMEATKKSYDALHNELLEDFKKLQFDKDVFFTPVFANYLVAMNSYYDQSSRLVNDVVPYVNHINRTALHERPWVITQTNSVNSQTVHGSTPTTVPVSSNSPHTEPHNVSHSTTTTSYASTSVIPPAQPTSTYYVPPPTNRNSFNPHQMGANVASSVATNPQAQQRVGSAVASQANNSENQARFGQTVANNSDNKFVQKAATNSSLQKFGGKAVGTAANNSAVQQHVGQQMSNQAQTYGQNHQ